MSAPFFVTRFRPILSACRLSLFRDRSTIFFHDTIITHIFSKKVQTFCTFYVSGAFTGIARTNSQ